MNYIVNVLQVLLTAMYKLSACINTPISLTVGVISVTITKREVYGIDTVVHELFYYGDIVERREGDQIPIGKITDAFKYAIKQGLIEGNGEAIAIVDEDERNTDLHLDAMQYEIDTMEADAERLASRRVKHENLQ